MKALTNELLHENGFKSYFAEGDAWFRFDNLNLSQNPEKGTWHFSDYAERFTTFEEMVQEYEKISGKKFAALPPIPKDEQFKWYDDANPEW